MFNVIDFNFLHLQQWQEEGEAPSAAKNPLFDYGLTVLTSDTLISILPQ